MNTNDFVLALTLFFLVHATVCCSDESVHLISWFIWSFALIMDPYRAPAPNAGNIPAYPMDLWEGL